MAHQDGRALDEARSDRGDWGRDDVRIEFNPGRGTSKITVSPAGEPAMFFEYISAIGGANQMVEWFAKTAGLPFAA